MALKYSELVALIGRKCVKNLLKVADFAPRATEAIAFRYMRLTNIFGSV